MNKSYDSYFDYSNTTEINQENKMNLTNKIDPEILLNQIYGIASLFDAFAFVNKKSLNENTIDRILSIALECYILAKKQFVPNIVYEYYLEQAKRSLANKFSKEQLKQLTTSNVQQIFDKIKQNWDKQLRSEWQLFTDLSYNTIIKEFIIVTLSQKLVDQ